MAPTDPAAAPTSRSRRTRDHLQRVALALIAEQGFHATTVEQIAGAAGVSHMTFFRYFPTKESVVLDDPFDPLIAAAVAAQPAGPALQRACRGLRSAVTGLELPDEAEVRSRVRIGASDPTLTAGMWANSVASQEAVAAALREDGSTGETEARVAAAAAIAALTSAVLAWGLSPDESRLSHRLLEALSVLDPA